MESGLIIFDKPPGVTSFDALRGIKRALGTGKVGHTGTLDKFAGGLLLVLTGKALKLSRWFSGCDKKYTGIIHFGVETDTLDLEGKEIAKADLPLQGDVEKALLKFTGVILQEPPVYSAIHVNGKRASSLARNGNAPEMKKREITIHKIELLSWQPPFAEIFVHCSSGTYIRSLARDIALAVNSRGHLKSLLRTDIAGFSLEMAVNKPGSGEQQMSSEEITVLPIDKKIISKLGLAWIDVSEKEAQHIIHGKALDQILNNKFITHSSLLNPHSSFNTFTCAVFYNENLIAVLEKINENWTYGCVM